MHSAPELVVAEMKDKEAGAVKKKKVAGWSTTMLEEMAANKQEFEETEEMVQ